jgi:GntR family transcriptional regulator
MYRSATVVGMANPATLPREPAHRRIAEALRTGIRAGRFGPGAEIPSEAALAAEFGVARGTVRQALAALRAEGTIASRRGARTTVLRTPRPQSFQTLLSFSAWARGAGLTPSGRVEQLARRQATDREAAELQLGPGSAVWHLVRLRLLNDEPVMVERTTFAEPVGRLVATLDLRTESVYAALAARGVEFARASHTIDAVGATALDASLLDVPRRTPLLRQRRRSVGHDGIPLEWSDDRHRGDAVSFTFENAAETAFPLLRERARSGSEAQ